MFKVAVFAIILDDHNRILLCHRRDYDLWNLPGGGVESGEDPETALIREIKEETGLNAKPIKLTGVYSKPDKNEIVLSFLCQVISGELTLNDEADKLEYFKINEIPNNTSVKQVERLKDFFNDKDNTHYRVQTGLSSIELIQQGKL